MMNTLCRGVQAFVLAAAFATASAAYAFGPDDAGIYVVYDDKNNKETDAALRFYLLKEKWVAEERAKDGSWTPFSCDTDCDIVPISQAQISRVFGKALNMVIPSCIANSHFALCSYTRKGNSAGKPGYMMEVNSPKGPVLLHLVQIDKL